MLYDLVVVGGGPGGIFAAIFAAERGLKVAIAEKMKRMGNKILAAGAGKCNLTHEGEHKEFLTRYGRNGKFLKNALYNFKPQDLRNFFEGHGLPLTLVEETGKYFPATFMSLDVLNLLYSICRELKVDIQESFNVEEIKKEGEIFQIRSEGRTLEARNVLLSTGGKSYPRIGTTGDGYILAKSLGHSIVEPRPALTPIYVGEYIFSDLSGISFPKAEIGVYRDNKKVAENRGSILLTHENFSAPGILDISREVKKGDTLEINFLSIPPKELQDMILTRTHENGRQSLKRILLELAIPERFVKKIMKVNWIDEAIKLAELKRENREKIVESLSKKRYGVTRVGDYDTAMVTTGGISLDEINPKTMESKLVKGLYFAGEVVDIDGDTGGFNIQAACSMGVLAAKNLK